MSSTRLERCGEDYDSLHCYIQRVGVEIEKVLEGNSKARVKEICPVSTSNNVKRYKIREHPPKTTGYVAKESTKENGCSQANGQVMDMDYTIHAVPQLSKDQKSSKERDEEFERRKAAICFGIGDFRPSRENSPKEVLFRNLSERGDIEDVRCNFLPSNSRKDVKKYKRSLSDSIRPVIEKPEYDHYYFSTRKPNWLNEDEQEDVFLRHSYSSITNDTQHFSSLAHSNTNNCDMKSSQHRKEIVNGDNPKHFTEHQTNTRVSESSQHQSFGRCIYCFSKVVGERCHCMYNSGERHRVSVSEDDIKKKQRAELLSQIYEDVKKVTRPVAQKENENVKQSNRTKSKKNHQHQRSSRRKSHDTPVSSQNQKQPDEITLQDNLLKSVQSIIQAPHNQRKEKAKHNSFHEDANQINLHPRSQAVKNHTSIVKDINPLVTHPHPNTQPSPPPLPPTNHPRARGYSDSDLDYIQDILEYDNLLLNATESGTSVFELDSDHPENYQHLVNFENNNHPDPRNTLYQKVVKPKGYKFRRLFSSEESLIIPPPPGFGPDDDVQVSISGTVTSTHHDEKGQREYSESFRRDYVSELLQDLADDELKQGLGWPNRDRGQTESVQLVDSCTVGTVAVSKDSQENVNGLPNNTGLPQVADVMVTTRKKNPIPATSSITCNLPGEGVTKQPPSSHSSHQRHRHPSGQHPSTNTLDADRQEKSEPQSYKIIGSFLDGHAPCENNTHDTPHDYCLLWADSSRHDLDHGCNTTGLSPFESFTNDLSESSYNILTYSSDSFQADECDVSQYNDYVKDSTSSDHSTDYLKHIFQDGCKENSPSRVNVSCDNGGQHIGFESGATCDRENAETTQSAPLDSHQYFENPLNCEEIPNDAALVCFADMNARQELLVGNDSLQHRNLRLFRKFEKSTPQSAINSKHDFISPGNVAPVSIRRKFSLDQQREPPIVLEDRNNNHLPATDDVVNYGSGHLPSGTNGLVEKHEGISTVPSRKDRQRYWLKDTAIQTSLDLNDTVDISGMPASEGFTIKRSSISHLRRLSKDKSPPKTVDDDVTYATVDKSSQRVKTIDKHVDKTPTISSQQGPEIPPRNRLVSRSKSLQTSHHKKAKKGRKNYLEKPSLSGSLKELSHLNIDVSQRLVDGERQYVVDNGSPEMQVIVNALTPVLLRRSRSGRASGKRRIDALCDRSNNSRDVQREEDALAVFQSETDSHRNERKHSIKSQVKVENNSTCQTQKTTSSANTEDQSERKIPIYARIRSHDGTHTKRTVKKKDFYEISKELKKLSRGTEKHPTSKSHSDATQKVTKSVGVSGENNTMKSNDNNAEGSLFLDPKQAHTWHGQGITDLRYRPAPRMGVGMVFIETTKLLAGSEISRQFRNNGNLSISSASSSKSPASTLPPSSHAQTLPIISRTLLDAMHKRYCSHQYARQTSTTLQPFSLLKIDPTSSQGGEPITALRVEPRSPKDHEVTAAPPSSLPSSLSSSASSSSHPVKSSRPTTSKPNRGIISEGESDYRSSTTESVQSSPRQQHLSESDTPKTVPACVKSTNQTSNADNRQKHNNEAGYESSHLVQGNASESKVIPQRPELRESKLQWESNHRVGKATYRRKYSLPELESVIECAHRHELSIVPQQIHQQHHQQHREQQQQQQQQQQQHLNQHHHAHVHCQNQLQQLQQGRNQAPCEDLHHPHLHQQQHHHHHHHHHHQQQQQQQQELNQSQCQDHEDTSYDTLAALEHEYHHTSLELQSAFDVSTGSVDSATDERLSHHGKSPAGPFMF